MNRKQRRMVQHTIKQTVKKQKFCPECKNKLDIEKAIFVLMSGMDYIVFCSDECKNKFKQKVEKDD
jgi:YHS domain-containing protein